MANGIPDWVCYVFAALLFLVALACFYRGFLFDRLKGQRRCPKCWYDMTGTRGLTCSECGFITKGERQLFKTRRRWRWVGLGFVIFLMACILPMYENLRDGTWIENAPNWLLIRALRWAPNSSDVVRDEVELRIKGRQLSIPQVKYVIERGIKGDWFRPPGTVENMSYYWSLYEMVDYEYSSDQPFGLRGLGYSRDLAHAYPPKIRILARDAWPKDTPFRIVPYIGVTNMNWQGSEAFRIRLSLRGSKSAKIIHINAPNQRDSRYAWRNAWGIDHSVELSTLPIGTKEVVFDVCTEWFNGNPNDVESKGDWETIENQMIRVPVDVGGKIHDIIRPVANDEKTEWLKQNLWLQLFKQEEWILFVGVDPYLKHTLLEEGLAINCLFEIRRGEDLIAETSGSISRPRWWGGRDIAWLQLNGDLEMLSFAESEKDSGLWTIRVKSDPIGALSDFPSDRYWVGEFETRLLFNLPYSLGEIE
ncbi:MAG: hypothetical protein O7G85_14335 [Planctomycetota bacterium]|nr:hypothetical protein [Planctomycetota bacterium]